MLKRSHLVSIALLAAAGSIPVALLAACSSSSNPSTRSPDGGTTTHPDGGGSDAATTTTPDSGSTTSPTRPPLAASVSSIPVTPYIVVDQFGYRPSAEKIAVARNPKVGFDVPTTAFAPGAHYALVDGATGKSVFAGAPVPWKAGATDTPIVNNQGKSNGSGDQTWWFTFSSVTTPGEYVVVDVDNNVRSYPFVIATNVYQDVLNAAVKMLYYQRSGIAKDAKYAGASWADGIAFQHDTQCQRFLNKVASTAKDLHGGWYDAGDYNKYTNWAANDVVTLVRAYAENPKAFGDDLNIPESGNGIPDALDEAMWEIDWLKRMQDGAGTDGSVLSIVGEVQDANTSSSPPSGYQGSCFYGDASTSAALTTAAAFAYTGMVFKKVGNTTLSTYADDLLARAKKAWTWAQANPAVYFKNNNAGQQTSGLGAGQQELLDGNGNPDPNKFTQANLTAAAFLYAATADATYKTFFEAHYTDANYNGNTSLDQYGGVYIGPWDTYDYDALLTYTQATGATPAVASSIQKAFAAGILGGYANNLPDFYADSDAYGSGFLVQYGWGSNAVKSSQGEVFTFVKTYGLDGVAAGDAGATMGPDSARAAERFIHYFHGVNPMQEVYLSNMGQYGAGKSVTSFFHSWYAAGTDWSQVGKSKYGPPPGYLVGGPNPSYSLDGCCTCTDATCCGGQGALCVAQTPPLGQPPQKSFKDFNDSWPVNSWSVSEPDDGYQVHYIHLLSKFVGN